MRFAMLVPVAMLAVSAVALPAQAPNPAAEPTPETYHHKDSPSQATVDAQEAPRTRELNATSALGAEVKQEAGAADQAAYQSDLAAYHDEIIVSRADAMRDSARFNRQQRAYADAMAQWRAQTAACEKGKLKACKLPTPRPADYY
jgi:hypothetical protein